MQQNKTLLVIYKRTCSSLSTQSHQLEFPIPIQPIIGLETTKPPIRWYRTFVSAIDCSTSIGIFSNGAILNVILDFQPKSGLIPIFSLINSPKELSQLHSNGLRLWYIRYTSLTTVSSHPTLRNTRRRFGEPDRRFR